MKAFWIGLPRDVVPANLVRSVHCGKLVMVITHPGPAALAEDPIQFTTSAQTAKRCIRDERPVSPRQIIDDRWNPESASIVESGPKLSDQRRSRRGRSPPAGLSILRTD